MSCLGLLIVVGIQLPRIQHIYVYRNPSFNNKIVIQDIQTCNITGGSPLSMKGLDGTGQIIGLVDSGINMKSCYFAEFDNSPVYTSYFIII